MYEATWSALMANITLRCHQGQVDDLFGDRARHLVHDLGALVRVDGGRAWATSSSRPSGTILPGVLGGGRRELVGQHQRRVGLLSAAGQSMSTDW